jgi:hypothetical protein
MNRPFIREEPRQTFSVLHRAANRAPVGTCSSPPGEKHSKVTLAGASRSPPASRARALQTPGEPLAVSDWPLRRERLPMFVSDVAANPSAQSTARPLRHVRKISNVPRKAPGSYQNGRACSGRTGKALPRCRIQSLMRKLATCQLISETRST